MATLKILTLNIGGWSFFDLTTPAPYIRDRLEQIPDRLRGTDADIILLQEVCGVSQEKTLTDQLRSSYPHIRRGGGSLMMFSRKKLSSALFAPFRAQTFGEGLLFSKGFLVTSLEESGYPRVLIVNTHLTSGGVAHPESRKVEAIRREQIAQMGKGLGASRTLHRILAGDFNAGPQASPGNFKEILSLGFTNCSYGLRIRQPITWDPKNLLNVDGPHKNCPDQHIDHVLITTNIQASARIVFKDADVETYDRRRVTISDHFGVLATLEM